MGHCERVSRCLYKTVWKQYAEQVVQYTTLEVVTGLTMVQGHSVMVKVVA
jgi:hypothetical protein